MQYMKTRDGLASLSEHVRSSITSDAPTAPAEDTPPAKKGHSRTRSVGSGVQRRLSIETGGEDGADVSENPMAVELDDFGVETLGSSPAKKGPKLGSIFSK
jgi:hypothetical protein